jgi:hypothetical protein
MMQSTSDSLVTSTSTGQAKLCLGKPDYDTLTLVKSYAIGDYWIESESGYYLTVRHLMVYLDPKMHDKKDPTGRHMDSWKHVMRYIADKLGFTEYVELDDRSLRFNAWRHKCEANACVMVPPKKEDADDADTMQYEKCCLHTYVFVKKMHYRSHGICADAKAKTECDPKKKSLDNVG